MGKLNFYPECFDTVTYNVGLCVYLALGAIRDKGFRQFLFFDGKDCFQIPQDYLKITHVWNYLSFYHELSLVEYIECDGFGSDAGYKSMKEYRKKHNSPLPEAIFAATDPIGIGIIKALSEEQIAVGKDVHIISMNGTNAGKWVSPAITSVDFHSKVMGKEAAILVKENAKKKERIPKCVSFAPFINKGGSL